jgi:hypothetical protein
MLNKVVRIFATVLQRVSRVCKSRMSFAFLCRVLNITEGENSILSNAIIVVGYWRLYSDFLHFPNLLNLENGMSFQNTSVYFVSSRSP